MLGEEGHYQVHFIDETDRREWGELYCRNLGSDLGAELLLSRKEMRVGSGQC